MEKEKIQGSPQESGIPPNIHQVPATPMFATSLVSVQGTTVLSVGVQVIQGHLLDNPPGGDLDDD